MFVGRGRNILKKGGLTISPQKINSHSEDEEKRSPTILGTRTNSAGSLNKETRSMRTFHCPHKVIASSYKTVFVGDYSGEPDTK